MQSVRQTAPLHHPSSEFVDQHHLTIPHDVILVALEQFVRAQALIDVMHDGGAFWIIQSVIFFKQIMGTQLRLKEFIAVIGKGHVAGFFIQVKMLVLQRWDQLINDLIHLGSVLRWARDDQWRTRLVDQDAVHLIDNCIVVILLKNIGQVRLHVVAQVIET